eukprot:GSChrysophyteH1.ASY1.ANO1.985.1 assembled CDS
MPPKRPPKAGSKAAKELKAKKQAGKEAANATVFDVKSLKGAANEIEDNGRTAAGTLISEVRARDIKIDQFSLSLHGNILVEDTVLELNHGSRYGLLGRNGCGKSSFLKCLAAKEAPSGGMTALEYVIDSAVKEVSRTRASVILLGLGFKPAGASLADGGSTIDKKTEDMSGGWRMRVALSKALFLAPSILLLDEPTNHLDLEACVWLEDYLATYKKILVVISHSQDFLNGVCTNMMVMQEQKLRYWSGNYDTYLYKKQQEEIKHLKEQKILDKMEADGFITEPYQEPRFEFRFADAGDLAPPLVSFSEVAFSYSGNKSDYLFKDVSFGIHPKSRLCLVGPNGAGKSTLLKLIIGELAGMSIGRFHQHSAEEWRAVVGNYGIPKDYHLEPIQKLSDGLRTRLVFCEISLQNPHLLLFDEPTNAADMELIDSMADAIKAFNGGVVVISHDFRLLDKVAEEVWVIDRGLQVYPGTIHDYKAGLKKKFGYKKSA